ncbi:ABC transporter substrate-binding protein [Rhodoligotrophos ferricapiens]|uniref:ABC transporter substrate-binding protein n=1 Tax=Rhodoligotrophos ferricapiens TaxID=3069264 RepID=UPI00315D58DC
MKTILQNSLRSFAAGLLLISASSFTAEAEVKELRMIEAGGLSGDSIEKGYIEPFTAKTGIKVTRESPAGLGKLRAMVEAKNLTADVVELSSAELEQAKALGLLDKLDWDAIKPDPIFPEAKMDEGLGWQYYSTILAWREDAKPISTWAEFWDVEKFPGKRTLPDYPAYILPMALIADGVKPQDLYPLDLDRAFAKLDQIKEHVSVWWQAGAQPPQLLKDNEVQYAVSWSGRVTDAEGIDYTFNQGQLDLTYFAVPKGIDPERKAAVMKLMHEITVAKNQAAAAQVVSYTGPSEGLDPLLPKDRLDTYPTVAKNKSVQFLMDPKWWYDHADEVEQRWQEFKLGL